MFYLILLFISTNALKWSCEIPYNTFELSDLLNQNLINAIEYVKETTGIIFYPRTNETSYVTIKKGDVCSSNIGRVGKQQFITLKDSCSFGIIIHELSHTIGLNHEHQRNDQEKYIDVYYNNIKKSHISQYKPILGLKYNTSMDFNSIMMYSRYDFNLNNQKTFDIKDKYKNEFCAIGQQSYLSNDDISKLHNLVNGQCINHKFSRKNKNYMKLCGNGCGNNNIFGFYKKINYFGYKSIVKFDNKYIKIYYLIDRFVIEHNGNYYAQTLIILNLWKLHWYLLNPHTNTNVFGVDMSFLNEDTLYNELLIKSQQLFIFVLFIYLFLLYCIIKIIRYIFFSNPPQNNNNNLDNTDEII